METRTTPATTSVETIASSTARSQSLSSTTIAMAAGPSASASLTRQSVAPNSDGLQLQRQAQEQEKAEDERPSGEPVQSADAAFTFLSSVGKKTHRAKLSIIESMLNAAKHGARKTHVMYRANLSYSQLEDYLSFLEGRGLIESVGGGDTYTFYRTSQKGLEFLKKYEIVRQVADPNKLEYTHRQRGGGRQVDQAQT
jgi:predicted transcriptional regulator